ncbi:ABC transporter ATP-binding protein [Wenzhouxiangella sp. AB-CW3]|uniref:ABC transporter ATP-binding protein n=1 Tax=Wenzhouxiangella sp. AB-CW3 TaxID=2771012 RepID=UPI001CC28C05|nr:ABC transporter ATP-binding protein [Wenzhouxiangella sp. AB-CW3]
MPELLQIEDLRFTWPGDSQPVLDLPEFRIAPGERVFLQGPSGSGKSTLLAAIGGLIRPASGRIRFDQTDLGALSAARRDRFRAEHLGVIFQQFNLLPWLDVRANVMLPCRFSKARARRAGNVVEAADALLDGMGLAPALRGKRADTLSVGQQQRVAAARALIGKPRLVLADEPTSALDHDRREAFIDLLFGQVEAAGSALLFVSHDPSLAGQFDRRVSLSEINRAGVVT